jgi:hypothetical protein
MALAAALIDGKQQPAQQLAAVTDPALVTKVGPRSA